VQEEVKSQMPKKPSEMTEGELEGEIRFLEDERMGYYDTPDKDKEDRRAFEQAGKLLDEYNLELERRHKARP
jgi:hypothetical protein